MTLRAVSSAVAFGFVALAVVLLVGDALLRGSVDTALRALGPGLLVLWAGWMLLVRPSIRIRPDRVIVVNVGRITEVPWARVVDIRRRLQLVLDLDDGRRLECWGSPFLNRRRPTDDPAQEHLRAAWQSAEGASPDGGAASPVVRRPDVVALAIGAAAVIAAVVSLGAGGLQSA